MSSRLQRSKWQSHNCSLINWTSAVISARRRAGIFQIEGATDVQQLDLGQPGERDLVMRPGAGHENRNLVFVGAVEGPFVQRGEPLDDVHRMLGALGGLVLIGDHR